MEPSPSMPFKAAVAAASPDAIFLLTDGEFPVEPALQVLQAMKAQGVRCPVHTVALGSQAGADTLRELSRITGGRTRVVK